MLSNIQSQQSQSHDSKHSKVISTQRFNMVSKESDDNHTEGNDRIRALNDGASVSSSDNPEATTSLLAPLSSTVEPSPSSADSFLTDIDRHNRTPTTPLSNSNHAASTSNSLSRRRNSSNRRTLAPSSPATMPPTAAATTASSSSRRRRTTSGRSQTIREEANAGGLRASLDSGMAAVRRWVRSRSTTSSPGTPTWSTASNSRRTGRTAQEDDLSSTSSGIDDISLQQPLSRSHRLTPPTIMEEVGEDHSLRQRALSEPDAIRIRDLLFQRRFPGSTHRQQRLSHQRRRGHSIELPPTAVSPSSSLPMLTSPAEVRYSSTRPRRSSTDRDMPSDPAGEEIASTEPSSVQDETGNRQRIDSSDSNAAQISEFDPDPNREARLRWICINRRFQRVITVVAFLFSLLLFTILVCWVVLTSAYVVSIDKSCDVPLKPYFWMVTLQLILDVFRNDIMRLFFRWDANSNQRIPCRVISYNIAYLTYAMLVLRLGVESVFLEEDTTCRRTAPELFQSSAAFISLSIAAWSTLVLGYLLPFCFVATLLTLNGYTPSSDHQRGGAPFTVFPTAMGAPPGCIDELRVVTLEEFPADYPRECCICMENFTGAVEIVETECNHVFHKECCREWLRQARTCPVCRTDIPSALENPDQRQHRGQRLGFGPGSRPFARNDLHHEVVSLLQILRHRDRRRTEPSDVPRSNGVSSQNIPVSIDEISSGLEEGRGMLPYSRP